MQLSNIIEQLKKYSYNSNTKNDNKKLIDAYENEKEDYSICLLTYLLSNNDKETYISVTVDKEVVSCLLYKIFSDDNENKKYYEKLKRLVINGDLSLILVECQK